MRAGVKDQHLHEAHHPRTEAVLAEEILIHEKNLNHVNTIKREIVEKEILVFLVILQRRTNGDYYIDI